MFFHRVIYYCLNVSVIISAKFNYNQSFFRYDLHLKFFSFNFQICLPLTIEERVELVFMIILSICDCISVYNVSSIP